MNRRTTRMRAGYAAASLGLVAAMGLVTHLVLDQRAEHSRAVAEALYHEDLRTAMWRLETRAASTLAMTLVLPDASAPSFCQFDFGLLACEINPSAAPEPETQRFLMAAADEAFDRGGEAAPTEMPAAQVRNSPQQIADRGAQWTAQQSLVRGNNRQLDNNIFYGNGVPTMAPSLRVGSAAPVFVDDGELHLARRVEIGERVTHESFRIDWEELKSTLLADIVDLFPDATLSPVRDGDVVPGDGLTLSTLPVRLEAPAQAPLRAGIGAGPLWALGGAWSALLMALGSGWLALRTSIAYGDKHRRFTQAVTHELRTPLTTFRMYSEMLRAGMVPEAEQPEYFATLETEAARLGGLVENVLSYARLEERRGPGDRTERHDLAALLGRLRPELARHCEGCGLSLEVAVPPSGPLFARTDAGALGQVLGNLVENACKYGPGAGGTIRIEASAVEGGGASLDVVDSGDGVPADARRRIFEPFDRGHRDSADPSPGVGLGLALCRALCADMGARLELMPRIKGEGARFRVSLPS